MATTTKAGPGTGLPAANELVPFAHGAAGHEGVSSNASGSLIIKPCTQAEITFYESAKDHPDFQAHMPVFMGSLTLNKDPQIQTIATDQAAAAAAATSTGASSNLPTQESGKEWVPSGGKQISTGLAIVLENAAAGFKHPCVLDLKLGARLWDDDAPEAKRQKLDQVASETTSGSLGLRVAGMKVWLGKKNNNNDDSASTEAAKVDVNTEIKDGYKSFNKIYGRNLTDDNVKEAFVHVIGGIREVKDDKTTFRRPRAVTLLRRFLREVKSIRHVLENQESRMYSASILLVLEGDDESLEEGLAKEEKDRYRQELDEDDDDEDGGEDEEDEELGPRALEVRLIDFAHARWAPGEGPDENALRGVRNVQKIVEDLLESASQS